jgi:uncharacterized protein
VRAVLDPNVLISALLAPKGAPGQVLAKWVIGEFELVVSPLLLAELERALAYPKLRERIAPDDAADFVSFLEGAAVAASDQEAPAPRSSDPGDDYLLALAEQAKAVLVSGDQHLLDLVDRFPVRSPPEFLDELER